MNCKHVWGNPIRLDGLCIECWKARAEEWEKKAKEIALAHGRTSVDWSNELNARQKAEAELDAYKKRVESSESEFIDEHNARAKAESACAEMRVILQSLHNDIESGEISPAGPFVALLEHALSSDVGKGWVSPAEASAMSVQHMNHVAIIGRLEAKLAIAVEALNRIWFAPCTCNEPVELCECAQRSAKEALSKLKEDKA